MASTYPTNYPKEVVAAIEGFTAALNAAKELCRQANSALRAKSCARKELEKEKSKGADPSTVANLTSHISATNKTYTMSLGQLRTLRAAARDARGKATQGLEAHGILGAPLECVDTALKNIPATEPELPEARPEWLIPGGGEKAAASSPLSSAPPSPGCSAGLLHDESAQVPVDFPMAEPSKDSEHPISNPGITGQLFSEELDAESMAPLPTATNGVSVGQTHSLGPPEFQSQVPMPIDPEHSNFGGGSEAPAAQPPSFFMSALLANSAADDEESTASMSVEQSGPTAEHAGFSPAGFPLQMPRINGTVHPTHPWTGFVPNGVAESGDQSAPASANGSGLAYDPASIFPPGANQFGFGAFHFAGGNPCLPAAFKDSSHFGAGNMSFANTIHDSDLLEGSPSWMSVNPIGDSSANQPAPDPRFTPRNSHPSNSVPRSGNARTQAPEKGKAKGRTKEKKFEPTLAALRGAVSSGNDAAPSPTVSTLFEVLPKEDDEPYGPTPSRHDIPGFNPLDLDSISYWECDTFNPEHASSNKKDAAVFTAGSDFDKKKATWEAQKDLAYFTRPMNSMPMSAGIWDLLRSEAGLLPSAMLHSYRMAIHIHTTNARNILCTYHRSSKKSDDLHVWDGASLDVRKGINITGVAHPRNVAAKQSDPVPQWVAGHLNCGCPEDLVLMEAILHKITLVASGQTGATGTWQHMCMDPRTRAFALTAFMDWTGLHPSDFFAVAPDGHIRQDVYAELLDRQISVLQGRRQALDSHPCTKPNNRNTSEVPGDSSYTASEHSHPIAPPRKRQKAADQSVDATLELLDSNDLSAPQDPNFSDAEEAQ